MEPIKLEIFMDDKTRAGIQSASGNIGTLEKQMSQIIKILEQDLKGLQQAFKEAMSQGVSTSKDLAEIQALKGEVNKLKQALAELKKQKETTSSTPVVDEKIFVSMDNVAKKTNNLKLQFSQVARELPSLAMGPQMFILAISNNLPMLADAIKDVRMQNELMTASGQKSVPVWKQLAGSLFSWQTMLVTAITLGIVYGKDIWNWVKTLGKAKTEITATQKAMEGLNTASRKGINTKADEIAKLRMLYTATQDTARSQRERNKAADILQKQYPKYFANLSNEAILAGKAASAYDNLTKALIRAGKAKATEDIVADYTKQNYQIQRAINADTNYTNRNQKKYEEALKRDAERRKKLREQTTEKGSVMARGIGNLLIDNTEDGEFIAEYERRQEEIKKNLKKVSDNNTAIDKISQSIKVDDITFDEDNKKTNGTSGKSATDYQTELADARLRAQQRLEAARIAVMQDGYKKRQAIARKELDEELSRIDKEERDTLKKMKEARKKGVKITPEEEKQVSTDANLQRALATDKYIKDYYEIEKEWRDKNIQSWIDYNKEYGTFQQKRLAITQDYNLKMQQEGLTDGERAKLGKEMEADLRELNMKEFKDSINFADVFGDLDAQSTEALTVLRDKLKEFINNSAKDLKPDDLKSLQDAFKDIDIEIKDRKPFRELKKDLADYKSAQAEVEKAQTELNQVVKFGSLLIEEYDEETGEVTRRLLTQKDAENNLTNAQKKRKEAMSGLIKSMGGVSTEISNISNAANSVLSTFDMLGIEVSEDVQGVVEGFSALSDGISNVVSAAQSGDIAGVLAGTIGAVGGAVKTLGSLFGADWGGEKSRRRYEEAKEKYESYMNVLDQVIGKQKELVASMEADDFANADNSYERARDLLKRQQDYAREMGKAYLNSGASKGFLGIGSSSSEGVKQRKDISKSAWEQARKALGSDFSKVADGRMTGLFDLTYEQLVKLRDEASGFWGELHQDTQDYLNQIIESEEAWQEVQEARKEALTKVDFDSFYDSFVSALSDMDSTSEDFAKNFEKYLQNAIFSALVAGKYRTEIENLYSSWADMAQSDKKLTDKGADNLREQYNKIVEDMLAEREQMMKDFGWSASPSSSSQSGRAGAVNSITEETGSELVGIGNNILDKMVSFAALLEELKKGREADSAIFAEIAENTAYCKMLEPLLETLQRWEASRFKVTM